MQDFKHDLTNMGDECICPMVSIFFGTTLFGNWDEDRPFPVLWTEMLGPPNRSRRYYEEVTRIHRRTIQERFS